MRNKSKLFLFLIICACGLPVPAQNRKTLFKDYPVSDVYIGKPTPVRFNTRFSRMFRTNLKAAANEKPNFAGHYIFTAWGCGTTCLQPAIINAKTGKVIVPPYVCCWGQDVENPFAFRLDSKLLVINGMLNEKEPGGVFYYKIENDELVQIKSKIP